MDKNRYGISKDFYGKKQKKTTQGASVCWRSETYYQGQKDTTTN